MEAVHGYLTKQLPAYLQQLPLPKTWEGFLELSTEEWTQVAPVFLLVFSVMLMILLNLLPTGKPTTPGRVNRKVKLDVPKVVDTVNAADVTAKTSYCRCWQSAKVLLAEACLSCALPHTCISRSGSFRCATAATTSTTRSPATTWARLS
jgi:hypothetical protein